MRNNGRWESIDDERQVPDTCNIRQQRRNQPGADGPKGRTQLLKYAIFYLVVAGILSVTNQAAAQMDKELNNEKYRAMTTGGGGFGETPGPDKDIQFRSTGPAKIWAPARSKQTHIFRNARSQNPETDSLRSLRLFMGSRS